MSEFIVQGAVDTPVRSHLPNFLLLRCCLRALSLWRRRWLARRSLELCDLDERLLADLGHRPRRAASPRPPG